MLTLLIIAIPGVVARHLFPGLERPDMVYPTMVLRLMPVGLLGVMLAALVSALTSTLSAILNSTSTLFTMDFYAKLRPNSSSRGLVRVGRLTSCVIIIIAALWAPQIGRFGSLLKYYQEMLSYIAPPVVATFLLGVFSRRVNAQGAFIGLVSGLVMAIVILIFKQQMFGSMHFLFIIPILFSISSIITWGTSLFFAKPDDSKLTDTLFDRHRLQAEWKLSLAGHFWSSSFFWAFLLIIMSISVWVIFS